MQPVGQSQATLCTAAPDCWTERPTAKPEKHVQVANCPVPYIAAPTHPPARPQRMQPYDHAAGWQA